MLGWEAEGKKITAKWEQIGKRRSSKSMTTMAMAIALATMTYDVSPVLPQGGTALPSVSLQLGAIPFNDEARVQAGQEKRIDVLANDRGVDAAARASLRILKSPSCMRAKIADGALLVTAGSGCSGEQRIVYALGLEGRPRTATVRIVVEDASPPQPEEQPERVVQPAAECLQAPDGGRMTYVRGGHFDPAQAPPQLDDLMKLLDRHQMLKGPFSVKDFCFMEEELGEKPWNVFRKELMRRQRRQRAEGESTEEDASESSVPDFIAPVLPVANGQQPANTVSFHSAMAFIEHLNTGNQTGNGIKWALPRLEEYIAALWRVAEGGDEGTLQSMLLSYYGSMLEWLNNSCGPVGVPGHLAMGPDADGNLRLMCLEDDYREKQLGLRLLMRRR